MASPTPKPPKQTWRNFSGINLFTYDSILGKGKHAWCPLMSSSLPPPPPPGTRTPTPSMWTPRGSQPGSKATQRPNPTPAKAATPHSSSHRTPRAPKSRKNQTQKSREDVQRSVHKNRRCEDRWDSRSLGRAGRGGQQCTEWAWSVPPHSSHQLMPRMGLRPNTPHLPSAPILAKKTTRKNPTPNPQNKNQNSFMKTK